jgi:uncharacterized membrane protein
MNPAIAMVLKDVGEQLVKASRKPLAKWMRNRAKKLREKQDEKDGIDTTGRS